MTLNRELRLGTRGSQLALWQARAVAGLLAEEAGVECRLVVIKTSGDHLQDVQLSESGGKRLFVKEIEDALVRGEVDLAVHSSKDLPVALPDGLAIGAVLPREDPRDAVVLPIRLKPDPPSVEGASNLLHVEGASGFSRTGIEDVESSLTRTIEDVPAMVDLLGPTPSIGTGSVRRVAQLARVMPGARFAPIRGNLDTRLRKLDEGQHDALVLAAAGLRRLGLGARISFTLPESACVPAPGQGIVAVEVRAADKETGQVVSAIDDPLSHAALLAERALVVGLGGGCQTPIGALARPHGRDTLKLVAIVVALDGTRAVRAEMSGPLADAEQLGTRVAERLIAQGAVEILRSVRGLATERSD